MRLALSLLALALSPGFSARAQTPISFDLGNGQRLETVRLEPGTFQQGSPENEAGRAADETQRSVTLTQPFLIGKFPITRGQFAAFVKNTGYRTEAERGTSGGFGWTGGKLVQRKEFTWRNPGFPQTDDHPVVIVEYKDVQAFCDWLSRTTGRNFTLPTEAQWEYASRAGSPTPATEGWSSANSANGTQPVGKLAANAWGLHDLLGNTWEWCEDWYAPYPTGAARDPLQTNPNLSDKPRRVLRGGAFSRPALELRPAKRFRNDPGSRNADNGFRVVSLDVRPAPTAPVKPTAPANPPGILIPDPPRPDAAPLEPSGPAPIQRLSNVSNFGPDPNRSHSPIVLIVMIFCAFGYFIVRKIFRSARSVGGGGSPGGGGPPQPGAPLRVRTVADGFWVSGQIPRGTPLRARWMAQGAQQERNFNYEPGTDGQFVFTGTQPISVSVMVVPSGGGGGRNFDDDFRGGMPLGDPSPRSSFDDSSDSGFRGHPSAY